MLELSHGRQPDPVDACPAARDLVEVLSLRSLERQVSDVRVLALLH